jgi:hypothetical protein
VAGVTFASCSQGLAPAEPNPAVTGRRIEEGAAPTSGEATSTPCVHAAAGHCAENGEEPNVGTPGQPTTATAMPALSGQALRSHEEAQHSLTSEPARTPIFASV